MDPIDRAYLARLVAADTGTPAPDAERRVDEVAARVKQDISRARGSAVILAFMAGAAACSAPSPRGQQPSVLVAIAMDGSPSPISWIGVLSLARGGPSNQFRTNDANLGHKQQCADDPHDLSSPAGGRAGGYALATDRLQGGELRAARRARIR